MALQPQPTSEKSKLAEGILNLANRAESCLILSNNLLKSKALRENNLCQWALCLENKPLRTTTESCAVSIGGNALLATGEGRETNIIQESARLVATIQREDGGWTSFSPSVEESLTIEAFFAIQFLSKADPQKHADVIKRGIDWLVKTENPETGGWGFYAGDRSHIDHILCDSCNCAMGVFTR